MQIDISQISPVEARNDVEDVLKRLPEAIEGRLVQPVGGEPEPVLAVGIGEVVIVYNRQKLVMEYWLASRNLDRDGCGFRYDQSTVVTSYSDAILDSLDVSEVTGSTG